MDRRLATTTDVLRFRVDATRCDGQGVCALVAPELFALDRYGLAYVIPGSESALDDPDVRARALEADAMCPRNAIRSELGFVRAPLAPAEPDRPQTAPAPARLVLADDVIESVSDWHARGGFPEVAGPDLLTIVDDAGILGHGGAGFPTSEKWRRVAGAFEPVVVANGAEREPGTEKDRYLLSHRPGLVLDGLRQAMHAVGAQLGVVAIDDDAHAAAAQIETAVAEATAQGLLAGLEIRIHRVPTRYVAGEETALLSVIEGGPPVPRIRPPYPSDVGLYGRPTLVQNVETLAQLAIAVTLGADGYRSIGTTESPGSGVFTVGRFGGPYSVTERPVGYSLRALLAETGLLTGTRAVLVGGYAGGLLAVGELEIALTPTSLRAVGASLGTKSIQVIGTEQCPVGVVTDIVEYFGGQTAEQCPPCSRGLPDMAKILRGLEDGSSGAAAVAELDTFLSTLFGRGVCRLPDGAARVALSLLTNFADDVAAHLAGGCPSPS
jgi:NADH:ubiquinone oxidoreductase subunit F (NADH-binding)/ferredoxin